ncbi:glycosyltransferase [Bdellovibrio sp. SKB1291214]|nr:glycosyltransferase [Bdellovibrio sp. SKB1291214]UYL09694.1 glycosyltransferase [Bdellovibrio sp. SKB1291214]
MESSESTPHCSLLVYLNKDADVIPSFLQDLRTFFQKFPMKYELIALVEHGADKTFAVLSAQAEKSGANEILVIHRNDKKKGRALSLYQGMELAQSPYVMILDSELASPFGDVFKLWQHLVAEEKVDICWGDRYRKKENPFLKGETSRTKTEILFNNILREKYDNSLQDPLCEVIALKKNAWEKIRDELPLQKLRGWYLTPALHQSARLKTLNIIEIPVYDSGRSSQSYHVWKERINLFRDSIFTNRQ